MLPATNPLSVQPISHMQLQWNTLKPDFYLNSIWNATQNHFYRLLSEYSFSADIISFHSIDILLKTQFNDIFFCVLEQDCCICFVLDLSKRVFHVFFFPSPFEIRILVYGNQIVCIILPMIQQILVVAVAVTQQKCVYDSSRRKNSSLKCSQPGSICSCANGYIVRNKWQNGKNTVKSDRVNTRSFGYICIKMLPWLCLLLSSF